MKLPRWKKLLKEVLEKTGNSTIAAVNGIEFCTIEYHQHAAPFRPPTIKYFTTENLDDFVGYLFDLSLTHGVLEVRTSDYHVHDERVMPGFDIHFLPLEDYAKTNITPELIEGLRGVLLDFTPFGWGG